MIINKTDEKDIRAVDDIMNTHKRHVDNIMDTHKNQMEAHRKQIDANQNYIETMMNMFASPDDKTSAEISKRITRCKSKTRSPTTAEI